MADLKQVLSEEIRRLARKEVKAAVVPLLQSISVLRKQCAELKKLCAEREKGAAPVTEAKAATQEAAKSSVKIRINGKMIRALRKKLELTQGELARCIGCNLVSVSHWELEKATPRMEQKMKLAALRGMSRKERKELFAKAGIAERKSEKTAPAPAVATTEVPVAPASLE
ncbi:MAG: helix-turn-helix transcriptional regulator [Victivallaceae bacterium]|nr:helix-turn-helix transcriptional regulator [Victivallaceae bacterium]